MDNFTFLITIFLSVCIALFGLMAVGASIYGILVWYPRHQQKRIDALKASGRQGEATIIRLPAHPLRPAPGRSPVFTRVRIGLEIRVIGIETYEVDKLFSIPTHLLSSLNTGKVVAVWVDPQQPRNLDKIVIHLD